jgi:4-methylaminobutanoate oxidase (formaldehyde-forming)
VRLDKPGGFLGREALVAQKEAGVAQRLRCLVLDDASAVALGNEPVVLDGEVVGRVTSGGLGFTVGSSIAYAYLPVDRVDPGTRVHVGIFGEQIPATVAQDPLYDPSGERVRA